MLKKNIASSDRNFGIFFSIILFCLGLYSYYKNWPSTSWALFFTAALILFFISFFRAKILSPFNKAWLVLGKFLGKIISPLILGMIFLILLTPVAFVCRLFGRDILMLKPNKTDSYWISRHPPGPKSDSFKNQF